MILDLPFWALTTPAEVWRLVMESFGRKSFGDSSDDFYNAAVDAIRMISEEAESVMNRKLIVREFTQRLRSCDWEEPARYQAPGAGDGYARKVSLVDMWPAVEVLSVDGITSLAQYMEILDEGTRFRASTENFTYSPTTIRYFAGYRRPDQIVASGIGSGDFILDCGSGSGDPSCNELTQESELASLSVMPPLVPGWLRRVVMRLVIYELREQIKGLPGFAGTRKTIEGVVIESLGAPTTREAWRESELDKLRVHRRSPRRVS